MVVGAGGTKRSFRLKRRAIFPLIAITSQDWQARVFREARICSEKFAQDEERAALGFDAPRVNAIGAQARVMLVGLQIHFILCLTRLNHFSVRNPLN